MERKTRRLSSGAAVLVEAAGIDDPVEMSAVRQQAVNYLADFEDTNLTPSDIADLRNFACQLCGKYKTAHLGSCDGCRWKKGE